MMVAVANTSRFSIFSFKRRGAKIVLDTRVRDPSGAIKLWGAKVSALKSAKLPVCVGGWLSLGHIVKG